MRLFNEPISCSVCFSTSETVLSATLLLFFLGSFNSCVWLIMLMSDVLFCCLFIDPVNLSGSSVYNEVTCILKALCHYFFHCTGGWPEVTIRYSIVVFWFNSITVFSFGPYLICTVFVQCVRMCVWFHAALMTVMPVKVWGLTVFTLDSLHSVSQWSACFCCLNKSCFHKNCNMCFIRKTIMWTLTSAVLLVNLSATMGIFTRLKFHRR